MTYIKRINLDVFTPKNQRPRGIILEQEAEVFDKRIKTTGNCSGHKRINIF